MTSPPYTNRGVYPPTPRIGQVLESTAFDAYSATVYEEPPYLKARLTEALEESGEKTSIRQAGSSAWYARNDIIDDECGKRLVSVQYGGQNGTPLVMCTGHASPVVASLLRDEFDHRPSRIDGAVDLAAPGLFEAYKRLSRSMAKKHGLRWEPKGDWCTADAGRTIMLGSRRSQVCLRVYEKGLEQAAKHGLEVTDEMRHHVRIEVEFKPQNPVARKAARTIEPAALWGLADWLTDFTREAFAADAERVKVTHRREADHHRALRFMAQQYRSHLEMLLDECGGDLDRFAIEILERAKLLPAQAA